MLCGVSKKCSTTQNYIVHSIISLCNSPQTTQKSKIITKHIECVCRNRHILNKVQHPAEPRIGLLKFVDFIPCFGFLPDAFYVSCVLDFGLRLMGIFLHHQNYNYRLSYPHTYEYRDTHRVVSDSRLRIYPRVRDCRNQDDCPTQRTEPSAEEIEPFLLSLSLPQLSPIFNPVFIPCDLLEDRCSPFPPANP